MFITNRKFASARIALILALSIGVLKTIPMQASAFNNDAFGSRDSAAFNPVSDDPASSAITIPTLDDWQTSTVAFSRGAEGKWDYYLWGGFANSLIKKNGVYYLYYQGAPSYNDQCDSVAYRGIGVAKSVDGVNWIKSTNNPVISWSSQGSVEEGAASSAALVGQDGRVYIYYGANTGSGCKVHANARLAVSEDGEHFQDLGVVLSGNDPNVWGSGDEIFPVGAYSYENKWYLYYIPNGVSLSRKLGVAAGTGYNSFTQTMGLNNAAIPAWGPVSIVLNNSDAVLFTNPDPVMGLINIYKFNAGNPSVVNYYGSYTFSDCVQASVLYDSTAGRWLMSCRNATHNYYLIKHTLISSPATFGDVTTFHWAWQYIERLYQAGITGGCLSAPLQYCPEAPVPRAQVAVFLLRGIHGFTYNPPAVESHTGFGDVQTTYWAAAWIKQLAAEGITGGCGNGNYCPEAFVTRAQMAVFLLRSKHGSTYSPPNVGGSTGFGDVPTGYWAAAWIKQLVGEAITSGCGGGNYCPEASVTRAQMAVFLVKTFNLP